LFPFLPKQPGYNKRLRRLASTLNWLIGALARDTSVWSDDVWVVDSTPVECSRSRETVKRTRAATVDTCQLGGSDMARMRRVLIAFAAAVSTFLVVTQPP